MVTPRTARTSAPCAIQRGTAQWLPSLAHAADRRHARLLRDGPGGLPGVRAPHQPGAGGAGRARPEARPAERRDRAHRQARPGPRASIPGRGCVRMAALSRPSSAMARVPTRARSCATRPRRPRLRCARARRSSTRPRSSMGNGAGTRTSCTGSRSLAESATGATPSRIPSWRARPRPGRCSRCACIATCWPRSRGSSRPGWRSP